MLRTAGKLLTIVALAAASLSGVTVAHASSGPPGPVQGLHLVLSTPSSLAIAWTPPATNSDDLTGYVVRFTTSSAPDWTTFDNSAEPTKTSATIAGLTAGQGYLVTVAAANPSGDGPATTLVPAVKQISTGGSATCTVIIDDEVECSDTDPHFQLGGGSTCAVMTDGTVECWGSNEYGQLGNGTNTDSLTPVTVTGISTATYVAVNGMTACALLSNGQVKCWGRNESGQLGNGTIQKNVSTPTTVVGISTATTLTMAGLEEQTEDPVGMACVTLADGTVKCWGNNDGGWLGGPAAEPPNTPVTVTGVAGAVDVSADEGISCATLSNGQVKCWGFMKGVTTQPGISTATSVAVGGRLTCVTLADHTVQCWPNSGSPTTVPGANTATQLSSGFASTCARFADGTLKCWGRNENGELGNGTLTDSGTPVAVSAIATATDVAAGYQSACSTLANGSAQCWGRNERGELGDGSTTNSSSRVVVKTALTYAVAARVPTAPSALTVQSQTKSTATLTWHPANPNGAQITSYTIQRSTNGSQTWHAAPGGTTSATHASVAAPAAGSAYTFSVIAHNVIGASAPSERAEVITKGTSEQKFTVQTPSGAAISGGLISWRAADGKASSSHAHTLTAGGTMTFAHVVPGDAWVTLHGGRLASGAKVTGRWPVLIGTDHQTLVTSTVPGIAKPVVTVSMPNGVPVVGAAVAAKSGLSATRHSGAFTFTAPGGGNLDTLTDGHGRATLVGYALNGGVPRARVSYNDGALQQSQTVNLDAPTTAVTLLYMPWLTMTGGSRVKKAGHLAKITFTVHSQSGSHRRGVKIAIKPPSGWTAKACHAASKLSGYTNSSGRLVLTVCASTSGDYVVKSHGAVATRAITLRVKGAPPAAPAKVTAQSPKPGRVAVSWSAPAYNGGAHVTAYKVTATLEGHKQRAIVVRKAHFTTMNRTYTFPALTRSKLWTIAVRAITRYGTGRRTTTTVRVAGV